VRKYALHPGWVRSKSDGDRHYITSEKLARLYMLRYDEWFAWDDAFRADNGGREWGDYIHLYPSYDGNYGRPNA
jgi:hypothetical protein